MDQFDAATEIRALIEGQFLAKRVHAENLGYSIGQLVHQICIFVHSTMHMTFDHSMEFMAEV